MCELCLCYTCPSNCPNADPPESVFICSGCGQTIYDGDDYWDILGEQFCEECVDNARRTAEYVPEEPEYYGDEWVDHDTDER